MKIQKEDLLEILEAVKPGLAKKEIIDETGNFVFTGTGLFTYNDLLCIAYPLESGLDVSIPSEEFYKIVKRLKKGILTLNVANQKLKLRAKNTTAELAVITETELPGFIGRIKIPPKTSKKWKDLPEELVEGMLWCSFTAMKSNVIPTLSGIYVTGNMVLTSDELRVSKYTLEKTSPFTFLLPHETFKTIESFEPSKFHVGKDWAFFMNDAGVIVCSRVLPAESYPHTELSAQFSIGRSKALTLPNDLLTALDLGEVLAEGGIPEEKRVDLEIKSKQIIVSSSKAETGSITTKVKFDGDIKTPIKVTINPIHLKDVLQSAAKVRFGTDRALFSAGPFSHLVSLFVGD